MTSTAMSLRLSQTFWPVTSSRAHTSEGWSGMPTNASFTNRRRFAMTLPGEAV